MDDMAKKSITSYDVARAAGVSQSAVSRAFSPTASIARKTRQHILDVAHEMGYQPNAIARSMSSARSQSRQRSGIVGVIVTRLEDPFFAQTIAYFNRNLQTRGWHMLLFTVESESEVDSALHELMRFKIDGVIVLSAILSEQLAQSCLDQGIAVLLYNRDAENAGISSVRIDNVEGGQIAADVLVEAGHKRIAFVAGNRSDSTTEARESGFAKRLAESGLEIVWREDGDYTFDSGREAALRLLSRRERPDAIFCASDVMALGVLHSARRDFKLGVPDDLSLIGFDDIPAAGWPDHLLTTIRQPVRRMIHEAVDVLIERMENPTAKAKISRFPGTLIVRNTVRGMGPRSVP
ncbi:MAG: LacI family DNA-binding transcriptional regulator [Alphaproteobacteria bacterium]